MMIWCILEIKWEEARTWPSNQFEVDNQSPPLIDAHSVPLIDNKAQKAHPASNPSQHIFTEIPLATFDIIFMRYAIVLGNTYFMQFLVFTQKTILRFLVDLERKSKTPSEIYIGTPIFLTLIYLCILLWLLLWIALIHLSSSPC